MNLAYLDCSSGISGDMFLAALLDAGVELVRLRAELAKIDLGPYEFTQSRVVRGGLAGNRVDIVTPGKQPHRHLSHIEKLIGAAAIGDAVKQKSLQVFRRLGEAEAKLHNQPVEKIHFHEVGAVDAILDIVGVCLGLAMLGNPELVCSPLNVGGGRVEAAHGTLPVPAPATAELLKQIPVYSSGVESELVTPTGAALVATLAKGFGPVPAMKVECIGYGAGTRDFPAHPNIVRLMLGEKAESAGIVPGRTGDETVLVIEANIDDMNPQLYGYFAEKALAAGALDVTCTPVQMKKNRPGLLVSILAKPELENALSRLLFAETTTIGLRICEARRKVLDREEVKVETAYGAVRMKVARLAGKIVNAAPEFEDCRRLADEKSVPLKEVMQAAQAAWLKLKD
ncbi:MAG: nickel pincer cofactor biosynthesis protein LarC [Acidobacteria bacterium]|nr:MAG: nickel pincer cofactor biosynthesis protein LarC [Acidobacteriota bacterium]